MKWITHQTGAVLGALALGMPWPAVVAACAGAVFPDLIDQKISALSPTRKGRQKIFNKIHRGASHWLGWWLALFVMLPSWPLPELLRDAGVGFAFGAMSHAVFDMLTPHGVPLLPFSRRVRVAVPLCSTGGAGEYLFLALMLGCGIFYFQKDLAPVLEAAMRYI